MSAMNEWMNEWMKNDAITYKLNIQHNHSREKYEQMLKLSRSGVSENNIIDL